MLRILILLVALALAGCCSTGRCYLARAQTALEASDPVAVKAIGAVCRPKVAECKGQPEDCAAYMKCRAGLAGYKTARELAGKAIVELNRILASLGVE